MKTSLRILSKFALVGVMLLGHSVMYGNHVLSMTTAFSAIGDGFYASQQQQEQQLQESSSSSSSYSSNNDKVLEMPPLLTTKIPDNQYVDNNTHIRPTESVGIPKVIYIFWEQGWDNNQTSPQAKLALQTWQVLNPDFKVIALDGKMAENLTNRSVYMNDFVWRQSSVQARSDVYRTLLLYHHGGIWVDASLFCNKPLSVWLDVQHEQDLFAFLRRGVRLNLHKKLHLYPWVASWFLAAPAHSYTISSIVQYFQAHPKCMLSEYNWWHRIVAELAISDDYLSRRVFTAFPTDYVIHANTKRAPDAFTVAPFFKRAQIPQMATALLVSQACCSQVGPYQKLPGFTTVFNNDTADDAFVQEQLCPTWDCTTYGSNFDNLLPRLYKHFASKKPRRKAPSIHSPPFVGQTS